MMSETFVPVYSLFVSIAPDANFFAGSSGGSGFWTGYGDISPLSLSFAPIPPLENEMSHMHISRKFFFDASYEASNAAESMKSFFIPPKSADNALIVICFISNNGFANAFLTPSS